MDSSHIHALKSSLFFLFFIVEWSMWVIFFRGTPHFWLIGGEAYRVGKKDCHVVIQDDRSISRVHLTIQVGVQPFEEGASQGVQAGACTHSLPQPITLTDSSTYGTAIASAGDEEDGETQDSGAAVGHGTTAALDMRVVGLRYAASSAAHGRAGSASNKNGARPAVPLTKGVPYDVPVHRTAWRTFTIQLGHHGAALRLAWVDVSVLCEDVDVEVQTKLAHALRYCGVRQEIAPAPLPSAPSADSATRNSDVEGGSLLQPQQEQGQLSQNTTLSERSAAGVVGASLVAPPIPAVLGGSSRLNLSQRTSMPATPSAPDPFPAAPTHVTRATPPALSAAVGACYNRVDFLVTSTVQPSTAVVGMLCRAVPIVSPAFFAAIRDRVSPQLPLPDPRQFTPPLSLWWCDLVRHARLVQPEGPREAVQESGSRTADTSAAASPASSSVAVVNNAASTAPTVEAGSPLQPPQLSSYFAPNPRRRELFTGVTFVVVQRALYEEVMSYLDCTGAAVVWEGGIDAWVTPASGVSDKLTFSADGFAELQSFFTRHQRHVLLYNETEAVPFSHCFAVLQQALGLCHLEYGLVIESIVLARQPPLASYPDNAHLPQTVAEVQARVRLALGEAESCADDSASQDSGGSDATRAEDAEATEGRRTDAQPLFPDVLADAEGSPFPQRKGARLGEGGFLPSAAHNPHKRPRREDADGWVTLGKVSVAAAATSACLGHGGAAAVAAAAAANGRQAEATVAKTAAAVVRTVDIHCSPYVLPPYPCFAEAVRTTPSSGSPAGQRKTFVKQTLPQAEPLVELEEHRARRQLAASMLAARVPTVDAEAVVPDQVVMGGSRGGIGALHDPAAEAAAVAFNTFDTAVHHASSRRRGTTARRGTRANAGAAGRTRPTTNGAVAAPSSTAPSLAGSSAVAAGATAAVAVDVDDAEEVNEGGSRESTAGGVFHIFDIDGIF